MPSSASTRLRAELQARGENLSTWGAPRLNNVINRLEEAIAAAVTITITTADYTLSTNNYDADEARNQALILAGTPAATHKVIIPAVQKTYWVYNTSGKDHTIGTSAGVSPTVRNSRLTFVFCDATDCHVFDPTLDSILAPTGDVSLNSHKLTNVLDPAAAQDAATKNYTDAGDAAVHAFAAGLALDTVAHPSGDVSFNSHKATNAATPTANSDLATKGYVDGLAFSGMIPAGTTPGQVLFWNGAVTNYSMSIIDTAGQYLKTSAMGAGTPNAGNVLRGDGAWRRQPNRAVQAFLGGE